MIEISKGKVIDMGHCNCCPATSVYDNVYEIVLIIDGMKQSVSFRLCLQHLKELESKIKYVKRFG